LVIACLIGTCGALFASGTNVEELKDRLATASGAEKTSLCIEISERQVEAAERLYSAGDDDKARAALTDVIAFARMARDYSIQAHRREKQSEIAIRKMTRKLGNLKHIVVHDEQKTVQDTIDSLEQVRDDLLAAMFVNGGKK
jgi:hypothetical protein